MKKNFKTMAITAMAIVIGIGMSSCSKEGENTGGTVDNGETTSVSIMLTESATRAVAAPVANETVVSFKSGYVLFTNRLGIINKVTEISATELAADDAGRTTGAKIWIEDLKTTNKGGEIKNVPAAATMVYIVGNLPTGVTAPALAENISAVKDRVISVASQSNAVGSVAGVTLYGDGAAIEDTHPTLGAGTKYAMIEVDAIAARIEIGKVSYQNATNLLTGFQIDGIFINYYYPEMSLASVASTIRVNNAPGNNTLADAVYTTAADGAYNGTDVSVLCDFDATEGLGYDITAISKSAADPDADDPVDNNVWAYNVLAPLTPDGTTVTALEAPHVIIRLSAITTNDDEAPNKVYPTTQYLTVKEFRERGTSNVISRFEPGYIYTISNLTFSEANLTDVPEQEAVTVYVEVKLMKWTTQEVDWGF